MVTRATSFPIRFGVYELNPQSGELRKHGLHVRLEGQPIAILEMLLERPGELVTREDLQKKLWPADTFVDFEHSLNAAVKRLRAALNDSAENPRYIETLARRGYRFIAPVGSAPEIGMDQAESSQAQPTAAHSGLAASARWRAAAAVLLVVAVVVTLWRFTPWHHSSPSPVIQSLAVLPLENLTGDSSQEYFADGMTEELITNLAKIGSLRVISRTSVMHYKGARKPLPVIARELGVDAIVEGSVARAGGRIRVTVQLIRGATDEHIWGEEYDGDARNILALQHDVARSIAERTRISLTPQERAGLPPGRTVDPEAHESYLKGRYYFNQRSEDAMNKSIAYFQQALAKDPDFALAYSGLADDYALLGFRGRIPSKDALTQAKAAALKAIELDSSLGEPHLSLAFIAETHEWDWETAEREYKRALDLNPGDARAHHWYAGYLTYVGRVTDGIVEEQRARELDPLSLPINNALAGRLLVAGRYDQAQHQVQKTLELDPRFAPAHQTLGWIYLHRGMRDEAIREFRAALQLSGADDTDFLVDLGFACATAGRRDEAQKILDRFKQLHQRGLVPSGSIAILYGGLGNLNEAFAWLEKAYDERDPELTYIKVGRRFEPLRADPRFQRLVRRIGLPE